ncbi:ABC transporter permease [Aquibaculum arenosum]|uniref:ABC transporter permease n=1 Tax=Aquibaculum arenosum TaxID=3032591 RepID=A0ABT5YJI9_9PROT|nr:ABC transporter permease [Fodinicurvata sp. CAU 1616]MDF2095013.1 ABC transporter permease [Fodinicurvata sp. CAU 1616]
MLEGLGRNRFLRRGLLLGPALFVIGFFMILPLFLMAYVSILERGLAGGVQWGQHTLEAYVRFLFERDLMDNLVVNIDYLRIFGRSFALAFGTMIVALAIGLPTAFYMALQPARWRNLLIFLVTIPFWTNLLVRNYAWILLLRDSGLVNSGLIWLGLTDEPVRLLYTPFAVGVGLTYSFLPFMILPIYASLEKLDLRLVEAAYDLGANKWKALTRIVLPLALPGIAAGSILVFIPALGAYVTPELLGGSRQLMIGNLIQGQFGAARNWPFGAALAFVLLAIVLCSMMLYLLRFRRAPGQG